MRINAKRFLDTITRWGDPREGDGIEWVEALNRFKLSPRAATIGEEDIRIVPGVFDFAGNADPAQKSWQPGGSGATFRVYEFAPNDEAFFSVQLPHDYKTGTNLRAHIHWTPANRGGAENAKTVNWRVDVTGIRINGTFGASVTLDLTDTCDGTDHKHQMTPEVDLSGASLGLSAMLIGRVYRAAGDTWATNTGGNCPVLLEVDLHYTYDRSRAAEEGHSHV